jgi:hypothetical protein
MGVEVTVERTPITCGEGASVVPAIKVKLRSPVLRRISVANGRTFTVNVAEPVLPLL